MVYAPIVPERVLFLCTHNSARSQIAEGILRDRGRGRYVAFSAGTEATVVRPLAIAAMAEIGIDISFQRSKTTDEFAGQSFDYVVTVCEDSEACPYFPGARARLHWPTPDPSRASGTRDEQLRAYRAARDILADHIARELLS